MNRGSKTILLFTADAPGKEVGKVQDCGVVLPRHPSGISKETKMKRLFFFLFITLMGTSCISQSNPSSSTPTSGGVSFADKLMTGADQLDLLLPKLLGKRVALVVNQTAVIKTTHLADTLKLRGVNVIKAFAPEHGFRGNAADGEAVNDSIDMRTGVRIVS